MPPELFTYTGRLLLRAPSFEDIEAWRQAHLSCAPPKNRWDKVPRTPDRLSDEDFENLLAHLKAKQARDKGYVFWAFDTNDADRWVATFSLFDILRGTEHSGWMGYHVFNPHWGQGYGTEGARAMLPIAFEQLSLHRIEALTELGNIASQRIAKKIGMRDEGIRQRRIKQNEQWHDVRVFAMTEEDYQHITHHDH